jgi:predicted nuclease of predicted toxin-antitoxin system
MGHDVHTVFDEGLAGQTDEILWKACQSELRFLVTQDLAFSDVRKYPPGSHAGIMVVRLGDDSRENLIRSVEQAWQGPEASKFASALVVVTEVKVRIRQRVDGDLAV